MAQAVDEHDAEDEGSVQFSAEHSDPFEWLDEEAESAGGEAGGGGWFRRRVAVEKVLGF